MKLTIDMRRDYIFLLQTSEIKKEKRPAIKRIAEKILAGKNRYKHLEATTAVPWWFIGLLHALESGCDFRTHLRNGDPLKARTVQVPKGRQKTGTPPFTFEESATDALKYDKLFGKTDWDIATTLYRLETFNGFGYRKPEIDINSPYLWSMSNHYAKGKFTSDHHYDPSAVSQQAGAAVILRHMLEAGWIDIPMADGDFWVKYDSKNYAEETTRLQTILNLLPGVFLEVDGYAGPATAAAFRKAAGRVLT